MAKEGGKMGCKRILWRRRGVLFHISITYITPLEAK